MSEIKGVYPQSKEGNFRIIDTIGVPHPYCIGSRLVAFTADHHHGILDGNAIDDAEKHEIYCETCTEIQRKGGKVLSRSEHEQALLVECAIDINPAPSELKTWLLEIKDEATKNGYVGFAFKSYEPPKQPKVWRNYTLPPTYKLGNAGCGCFLEPPDHPSYFVKSIYTRYGNSPPRPPYYYLNGNGYENLEDINHLFKPLPYDSPRVKAWEEYCYKYFHDCYSPDGIERNVGKAVISGGQPPEHHLAHLHVKKYYPEALPRLDLIENPPPFIGTWWERHTEKPTPETCQGENWAKHPVNGTWCQVCGWGR